MLKISEPESPGEQPASREEAKCLESGSDCGVEQMTVSETPKEPRGLGGPHAAPEHQPAPRTAFVLRESLDLGSSTPIPRGSEQALLRAEPTSAQSPRASGPSLLLRARELFSGSLLRTGFAADQCLTGPDGVFLHPRRSASRLPDKHQYGGDEEIQPFPPAFSAQLVQLMPQVASLCPQLTIFYPVI